MSMIDPTHNEEAHATFIAENGFDGCVTLWFKSKSGKPWDYTVSSTTNPALGIPPGLMLAECVKGTQANSYIRPMRFSIRHATSGRRIVNADLRIDDAKLVLSKLAPLTDWDESYRELVRLYADPDCTLWPKIQRLESELGWSFPCLT